MKLYSTSRVARRLQERFQFKAERDASPKSAMTRRPYPPGMHGKRRSRGLSEYGGELVEKQKIRYQYGLSDHALERTVEIALRMRGRTTVQSLLELLERRLDNVVFRLGFAPSRRVARQLVSYGFIAVNGTSTKVASWVMRTGDVVSVRPEKKGRGPVAGLEVHLKKHAAPAWLSLDPETFTGKVTRLPTDEDEIVPFNLSKVIEYYSR